MMQPQIHCLYWPNVDKKIVNAHKKTCEHLGLVVNYTEQEIPHGLWMDNIMMSSIAEAKLFLDIDCVPTNKEIVDKAIGFALHNKSMVGIAQVSNHIAPYSHIYAAPAFLAISRDIWDDMGRPSFCENETCDVAENVSYAAEIYKVKYKTLYPTHYMREPEGGAWDLHTYGKYGIGTHFEGGVLHLYQGRMPDNAMLFHNLCKGIRSGEFKHTNMTPSRTPL